MIDRVPAFHRVRLKAQFGGNLRRDGVEDEMDWTTALQHWAAQKDIPKACDWLVLPTLPEYANLEAGSRTGLLRLTPNAIAQGREPQAKRPTGAEG